MIGRTIVLGALFLVGLGGSYFAGYHRGFNEAWFTVDGIWMMEYLPARANDVADCRQMSGGVK